jgi:hypothetical protein
MNDVIANLVQEFRHLTERSCRKSVWSSKTLRDFRLNFAGMDSRTRLEEILIMFESLVGQKTTYPREHTDSCTEQVLSCFDKWS